MAGLADDEYETRKYVLFQKSHHPERQDVALGHDKPHITLNDERFSTYGGVEKIIISEGAVHIMLNDKAAVALNSGREILISYESGMKGVDQFVEAIRKMYEDVEVVVAF